MSESLANRVGRIISGGFNAMLEAIENTLPETVMEQALREVEQAIEEVRFELGRVLAGKHLAGSRLDAEKQRLAALTEQIETALIQQREDLAEAAIAQQLDIEAQLAVLDSTCAAAANQEQQLQAYIQALQAKKREMQEQLRLFKRSQLRQGAAGDSVATRVDVNHSVENASRAFDRAINNAAGLDIAAQSSDAAQLAKLAELDELARKNRIRERLDQLKRRDYP